MSQEARTLIKDFDAAVNGLNPLAADRAALNPQILEGNQEVAQCLSPGLECRTPGPVFNTQIEELKDKAHLYREELANCCSRPLFSRIQRALLSRRTNCRGAESDGRTWRVRVGNKAIKLDNHPDAAAARL